MMTKSPPETIWLQWHGNEEVVDSDEIPWDAEVSWCEERVFLLDIKYHRTQQSAKHCDLHGGLLPCAACASMGRYKTPTLGGDDKDKRIKELEAVLIYYRDECSGHEPSLSVFQQMLDEALEGDTG